MSLETLKRYATVDTAYLEDLVGLLIGHGWSELRLQL